MKVQLIQSMLSDPNIDPTPWVGEALLTWVKQHLKKVISNPTARRYIYQGIEEGDVANLTSATLAIYEKNQDPEIIEQFVSSLNELFGRVKVEPWAVSSGLGRLFRFANREIIDSLVKLKVPNSDYILSPNFLDCLRPRHVKAVLKNHNLLDWHSSYARNILLLTPSQEQFSNFKKYVWPKLKTVKKDPDVVQKTLYDIFLNISENDAKAWFEFLKDQDISILYSCYDYNKIHISARYKGEIKISENLCLCGFITSSRSGYKLHTKKCIDAGNKPNLYLASKIFYAQNFKTLICDKCGRTCKSDSGLTLHRKKCKSPQGEIVEAKRRKFRDRAELRMKAIEHVDTTSNQMPR